MKLSRVERDFLEQALPPRILDELKDLLESNNGSDTVPDFTVATEELALALVRSALVDVCNDKEAF